MSDVLQKKHEDKTKIFQKNKINNKINESKTYFTRKYSGPLLFDCSIYERKG